jgi:multidrug efflux pump subunit AcrB
LANDYFAQAVVITKGFEHRKAVEERLKAAFATGYENALIRVSPLEMGPPVGWPLKFRISGPDPHQVRQKTFEFTKIIARNPAVSNINYNWNEQSKVIVVDVDQEQARALGLSSSGLANAINAVMSGTTITQLKDSVYLVDIVGRANDAERATLQTLRDLRIAITGGESVPLAQLAKLSYRLEPPLIWRRNRLPTITIQAEVPSNLQPATVNAQLSKDIEAYRATLPPGYDVAIGGATEDSAKSQASIFAVVPLMIVLMVTILMVQLMSFQRLIMVLVTAPLALIGVAAALLLFNKPMGFVAILGILSLAGMVIRNSVILIDKIDTEIADGVEPWTAVIDATAHRLRPILLTAAAAIFAMIPISRSVFWGPMAYAIMGGLAVATLLTLVFLPALYVAWFRIAPDKTAEAS